MIATPSPTFSAAWASNCSAPETVHPTGAPSHSNLEAETAAREHPLDGAPQRMKFERGDTNQPPPNFPDPEPAASGLRRGVGAGGLGGDGHRAVGQLLAGALVQADGDVCAAAQQRPRSTSVNVVIAMTARG